MAPPGRSFFDGGLYDDFVRRFLIRPAQFARWPALELPRTAGTVWGFVLGMTSIDLVLRLGTVWLTLLGTRLLGGAEYAAIEDLGASWFIVVLVVIVAPLTEETAMRLLIHPWSSWRFWLSAAAWMLFGVNAFFTGGWAWIVPAWPIVLVLWRLTRRGEKAARQWSDHPGLVVWFCVIGFGLAHISNYDIPATDWRVATVGLLVVPQLIGGLLITYTRVKAGYWAGVAHHALSNAPFALAFALAS